MAKIVRYDADMIEAGDTIVVKEGRIRKFYHICEFGMVGDKVHIVYNGRHGEFVHLRLDADDRVAIREG